VHDTPASRAVAWCGVALEVVGIAGLLLLPSFLVLWIALIAFGAATVPRAVIEWLRERRKGKAD
jgi:hypothetical protein